MAQGDVFAKFSDVYEWPCGLVLPRNAACKVRGGLCRFGFGFGFCVFPAHANSRPFISAPSASLILAGTLAMW